MVIDLDVHQGNGTAEIFQNDSSVYTFSMHADANYPWSSRIPGDLDVPLPNDITDSEYVSVLEQNLTTIHNNAFNKQVPELVIYQAGVDPLKQDRLGKLSLTHEGLRDRNDVVYQYCHRFNIPCIVLMGGGYSRPIEPSAKAHLDVFTQAAEYCSSASAV